MKTDRYFKNVVVISDKYEVNSEKKIYYSGLIVHLLKVSGIMNLFNIMIEFFPELLSKMKFLNVIDNRK